MFLARGFRRHGGFVRWCSNVGLRPRLGPCRDHWGRLGYPATWGTRGRFGPGQIRHRGIWITWRGRYRPASAAMVGPLLSKLQLGHLPGILMAAHPQMLSRVDLGG
ncbi:hypothetical protein SRB521_01171 [Intestinimonas butyriciproducens]|nr:hypothetical protein SRB521_01171 [Intestinimonas butyriciproducens]